MPVLLFKPVSRTPLEMVREYQKEHPEVTMQKIGYAGRLDPMAEGLLVLLVGDENKEKKKYEDMDKEYEFSILFGMATDSSDLMGSIERNELLLSNDELRKRLPDILNKFLGAQEQEYPSYSSAHVNGKPMYWWARRNRLSEIKIPVKKIDIKELELLRWRTVSAVDVARTAIQRIKNVSGDFRQEQIINQWQLVAEGQTLVSYPLADCRIVCSSGTYIRALCKQIGNALKTTALAYSIKRTRIGQYSIIDSS